MNLNLRLCGSTLLLLATLPAAAFFDPTLGRWASRDPIEEAGGSSLYRWVNNDGLNQVDAWGCWNTKVHLWQTFDWSQEAGITLDYDFAIANADEGVDTVRATSPYPVGQMERHLNQPSKTGGRDSREYWYAREYSNAVVALTLSDRSRNAQHCVDAARAFGRGLHSWQDRSAHRLWPFAGRDWGNGTAHPAWWDDWYGETNAGVPVSDEYWANYHQWHAAEGDYDKWRGSPVQVASQERARTRVAADSRSAVQEFVVEIKRHCFCRQEMLVAP